MLKSAIFGMSFLSVLGMSASGQIVKRSGGYYMRLKQTKGASYKYLLTSEAPGVKLSSPFRFTYKETVKDSGTIQVVSGPSKMNGATQGSVESYVCHMDNQGKPLDKENGALGSLSGVVFARTPQKVGQRTTMNMPVKFGDSTVDVTTIHKIVGEKKVGSHKALQMEVSISGKGTVKSGIGSTGFSVTGSGIKLFDMADGHLLSSKISQTISTRSKERNMTTTNSVSIIRQ